MSTFTRRTLVSAVAAGGFGVLAKSDTQAAVLFGQSQEETIGRNSRCCSRTATSATYRTAKRMPTAATRRGRAGTASWRSAPARQWSTKRWRCLAAPTQRRCRNVASHPPPRSPDSSFLRPRPLKDSL